MIIILALIVSLVKDAVLAVIQMRAWYGVWRTLAVVYNSRRVSIPPVAMTLSTFISFLMLLASSSTKKGKDKAMSLSAFSSSVAGRTLNLRPCINLPTLEARDVFIDAPAPKKYINGLEGMRSWKNNARMAVSNIVVACS